MQIDLFTKAMLCVIALSLSLLAARLWIPGEAVHAAVSDYEYVRYMGRFGIGNQSGNVLLDARNGDLWGYGYGAKSDAPPEIIYLGRLTRLGDPLVPR